MDEICSSIVVGIFLLFITVSIGYLSYTVNECRIAAIKSGKSADDIKKICG